MAPLRHCLHVWPWVKRPAQRFVLPNWEAITIGRHIISWRPLSDANLAHEVKHVEQWRQHGVRFIVRYLGAGRRAAKAGGDRYRDNPFEIEARAAEKVVGQNRRGRCDARPAGRSRPS